MDRQFAFRCHPWDIEDEGVDVALGRLAGDLGIDTLTLTATHPGVYQIRPRALADRWTFDCGAAAFFQPDSGRHGSSRIRPQAATWLKSRNPLERIAKVAERERLRLRVRVSCLKGEEWVARHSHSACVNVFGDASREWLCPSHPDVRAYVTNLIDDLWTNYGLEAIELEHLDPMDERTLNGCLSVPEELAACFASTCFCASCRQRAADASIDLEALRTFLIDEWRSATNPPAEPGPRRERESSADSLIRACSTVRIGAITSLVQSVKRNSTVSLRYVQPMPLSPASIAASNEVGISIVRVHAADSSLTANWSANGTAPVEAVIPTHAGAIKDGPALVALVHQLVEAGCGCVGFDHYGATSETGLEWIRQAVRYARRESGS